MWRLDGFDLARFVAATLDEDLGTAGDITGNAVVPPGARMEAALVAREPLVLAGLPVALAFFVATDPTVGVRLEAEDGQRVTAGTTIAHLHMDARALLAAERSALNTLCHLSGVATLTRRYADRRGGHGCPRARHAQDAAPDCVGWEKYAARMGGAVNHRMGLWDAAMIKDNHVAVAGGVGEAVRRVVQAGIDPVIVGGVDRLDQIEPAIAAGATRLLLDNMDADVLRQAVALVDGRVPTEASGGVRPGVHPLAGGGGRGLSVRRSLDPERARGRHRARRGHRVTAQPSRTAVSGWWRSRWRLMVRRLRVFER